MSYEEEDACMSYEEEDTCMPIEIEKPQATCRRAASMSFLAMALASSEVVATA